MNSGMKSETKAISKYSVKEILAKEPYHLMELFRNEYGYDIPETIDTVEDMRMAGKLLGRLANSYSYLMQLSSYAKLDVRTARRDKNNKQKVEDAIDRKNVIDTFGEAVGLKYKAISRMLTIKQQINEELKMTDGR